MSLGRAVEPAAITTNEERLAASDAAPVWPATARYGLLPAPAGLALIQDLLNTRGNETHEQDMLSDSRSAEVWAAYAIHAWSVQRAVSCRVPVLTEHDVARIRDLRSAVEHALTGNPRGRLNDFVGAAQFAATSTAAISWIPKGHGWRWFCGAILGEILLSRNADSWRKMKICRNDACRAAFYDRTWDLSAVWHNPACPRFSPTQG
jgi:hypothetical protein